MLGIIRTSPKEYINWRVIRLQFVELVKGMKSGLRDLKRQRMLIYSQFGDGSAICLTVCQARNDLKNSCGSDSYGHPYIFGFSYRYESALIFSIMINLSSKQLRQAADLKEKIAALEQ